MLFGDFPKVGYKVGYKVVYIAPGWCIVGGPKHHKETGSMAHVNMTTKDDDPFAPTEADIARLKKDLERYDSPVEEAKRVARRKMEFEKGVRLGWWDKDGNPLELDEDEDDEGDDDDDDDI